MMTTRKIVIISSMMHQSVHTKGITTKLVTTNHIVNMIATIRIMIMVMLKKKIVITVHTHQQTVHTNTIIIRHVTTQHIQVQPAVIRRHIVLNLVYVITKHIVPDHVHIPAITI